MNNGQSEGETNRKRKEKIKKRKVKAKDGERRMQQHRQGRRDCNPVKQEGTFSLRGSDPKSNLTSTSDYKDLFKLFLK